ncbi:Uu.00g099410.m01.CDS01 [Anthostomella pinea]|uniref:Uu.00g099410.m01.CDS01 n=1 Tax=Anthostomella pinea TaxID=933095 RepID=A0AAI8YF85_9PEZI|nr:Uu.00g099410.m01.CDS01 [Anthostomella pinea]
MSAIKYTWDTGSMTRIRKSFLHHKLEAIKFVNEQLQDPSSALTDCTVASIAALALAESALGCRDTAKAHMGGLAQLLGMQEDDMITDGNIFQSLVILTSRGTGKLTLRELLSATRTIENQESLGLTTFRAIGDRFHGTAGKSIENSDRTVGEALEEASDIPTALGLKPALPPSNAVSRARLMSCYLCIFAILGANDVDPFMLNWLIEWMLSDLCHEEDAMRQGTFPRQVWFWGAMMATCAVSTARPNTALAVRQIEEWRELCHEKIRLVSHQLNVRTWEQAKRVFVSWVWRDDFDEEQQVKEMWEEAVYGKRIAVNRTASPSCFDRRDFMSARDRAKSIVRAQVVHMRRLMLI